ncbi:hypothetical protein CXG81DRAFT_26396 [Caulochytrium protostelioides]|uniref:SET domain-containing protein n=1 Tax=Caulochytrium protostelioides TaxID=1555241 RepID=A0A4P9X6U6_9FUNG|nr:hypothetical protein CXG81DRAFT_26396 [Caulochytrium protostelioides]|eukprot:RKP00908.1 hypothetical protein CXG81DRAFT_26396 [Caulochytrium protostelioides]
MPPQRRSQAKQGRVARAAATATTTTMTTTTIQSNPAVATTTTTITTTTAGATATVAATAPRMAQTPDEVPAVGAAKLAIFRDWLKEQNVSGLSAVDIQVSGYQPQLPPTAGLLEGLSAADAAAMGLAAPYYPTYAVTAAQDLKVGAVVAKIPKNAILSAKNCGIADLLEEHALGGGPALAMAVAFERSRGTDSPWWGYLQLLPDAAYIPPLWTPEEQMRLAGTDLETMLPVYTDALRDDYERLVAPICAQAPAVLGHLSFERYVAAMSLVTSRSFQVDAYHTTALIPVADLFNHATNREHVHFETDYDVCPECGELECACGDDADLAHAMLGENADDSASEASSHGSMPSLLGDDAAEPDVEAATLRAQKANAALVDTHVDYANCLDMTVVRAVNKGDEIYNTYGAMTNAALLNRYAFVEPGNPEDTVLLDPQLLVEVWCHPRHRAPPSRESREDPMRAVTEGRAITQREMDEVFQSWKEAVAPSISELMDEEAGDGDAEDDDSSVDLDSGDWEEVVSDSDAGSDEASDAPRDSDSDSDSDSDGSQLEFNADGDVVSSSKHDADEHRCDGSDCADHDHDHADDDEMDMDMDEDEDEDEPPENDAKALLYIDAQGQPSLGLKTFGALLVAGPYARGAFLANVPQLIAQVRHDAGWWTTLRGSGDTDKAPAKATPSRLHAHLQTLIGLWLFARMQMAHLKREAAESAIADVGEAHDGAARGAALATALHGQEDALLQRGLARFMPDLAKAAGETETAAEATT